MVAIKNGYHFQGPGIGWPGGWGTRWGDVLRIDGSLFEKNQGYLGLRTDWFIEGPILISILSYH